MHELTVAVQLIRAVGAVRLVDKTPIGAWRAIGDITRTGDFNVDTDCLGRAYPYMYDDNDQQWRE